MQISTDQQQIAGKQPGCHRRRYRAEPAPPASLRLPIRALPVATAPTAPTRLLGGHRLARCPGVVYLHQVVGRAERAERGEAEQQREGQVERLRQWQTREAREDCYREVSEVVVVDRATGKPRVERGEALATPGSAHEGEVHEFLGVDHFRIEHADQAESQIGGEEDPFLDNQEPAMRPQERPEISHRAPPDRHGQRADGHEHQGVGDTAVIEEAERAEEPQRIDEGEDAKRFGDTSAAVRQRPQDLQANRERYQP